MDFKSILVCTFLSVSLLCACVTSIEASNFSSDYIFTETFGTAKSDSPVKANSGSNLYASYYSFTNPEKIGAYYSVGDDTVFGTEDDRYIKIPSAVNNVNAEFTFNLNGMVGSLLRKDIHVEFDFRVKILEGFTYTQIGNADATPRYTDYIIFGGAYGITPLFVSEEGYALKYWGDTPLEDIDTLYQYGTWYNLAIDYTKEDNKVVYTLSDKAGVTYKVSELDAQTRKASNMTVKFNGGTKSYGSEISLDNLKIDSDYFDAKALEITYDEVEQKYTATVEVGCLVYASLTNGEPRENRPAPVLVLAAYDKDNNMVDVKYSEEIKIKSLPKNNAETVYTPISVSMPNSKNISTVRAYLWKSLDEPTIYTESVYTDAVTPVVTVDDVLTVTEK